MFEWSAEGGLAALFAAAFLSATVLPGNSEVVLYAVLRSFPESGPVAILLATAGNTLGGLTTYGLGRLFPDRTVPKTRSLELLRRYGVLALLFSWVPVVGDALCAAAGWLRLSWWRSAIAIATGKAARYVAVALVALQ